MFRQIDRLLRNIIYLTKRVPPYYFYIISRVRRTVITDSRELESDFYERTVVVLGPLRRTDNDMYSVLYFSLERKKERRDKISGLRNYGSNNGEYNATGISIDKGQWAFMEHLPRYKHQLILRSSVVRNRAVALKIIQISVHCGALMLSLPRHYTQVRLNQIKLEQ